MTTDDSTPGGTGQGLLTDVAGRRTDPHEWRAFGAQLARAGRFPARSAASFTLGFWSEWRKTDPSAHEQVERADVLDRIAAFTDELNEMLTRDRNPLDSLHHEETDNASGVPVRARNADSLHLLANCEKALRAAAATIPA